MVKRSLHGCPLHGNNHLVFEKYSGKIDNFLGMPEHTKQKLYDQTVAYRTVYLHAKHGIYTSNSYWDSKFKKPCKMIGEEHIRP